ncbi:MAG: hypothetical protein CM1200mP2_31910 [Planctomycetaceae bacterium]|nr:MAG: hypothetical protein CM1200mP2_31910 [Planctomycetaceae bacterium]
MLHRRENPGPETLDLRQLQVAQGHLALSKLIDPDGYGLACRHLGPIDPENRLPVGPRGPQSILDPRPQPS